MPPYKAFTPGDWSRNGFQIVVLHCDEYGKHETLIADIYDQHDWAEGNARLIRAAPDLLIALIMLVTQAEFEAAEAGEIETPWLNEARAAIAKAVVFPRLSRPPLSPQPQPERTFP